MINTEFHNRLSEYYNVNNTQDANRLLMSELGKILVKDKGDFIFMLTESGIYADENMSDTDLINLFVDNLHKNKRLRLGASLLVNTHNKKMNFDGSDDLSDDGVKMSMIVLDDYFACDGEESSNVGGFLGSLVDAGAGIGGKVMDSQRSKKFGVTDSIAKQKESKQALLQQVIAKKQADTDALAKSIEQKQKTKRTLMYVGGSILAIALIIGVVYFIKRKKK